ncbi:hypothetical protein QWJ34_22710 [Saccharibacillus sp. CPCC 101409]|uniref:hypothetical protein n=1 Tax=Saccharibacillus sp. CPCC 101409 TaxID=3058041 RepID=UPI0026718A5A|nr:hypothetical protein [Saccharibacillus sp. CPCC 101409]MDO3412595.1 hypothetical protein [Saccharibacillus sp. CPCC 101409]
MAYCSNCGTRIEPGEVHVCGLEKETPDRENGFAGEADRVTLQKQPAFALAPQPEVSSPMYSETPPQAASAQAVPAAAAQVAPAAAAGANGAGGASGQPGGPSPAARWAESAKAGLAQIDTAKLVGLLRNPLSALKLQGDKDLPLGVIGIAASLLGFVLWAWSFKHRVIGAIYGGFEDLGLGDFGSSMSAELPIVGPLLLTGLVSLAVLLAASYLIGVRRGEQKLDWREGLTRLGGLQLFTGALFLVGALAMFASPSLSFFLLSATLLLSLSLTLHASISAFRIAEERAFLFMLPVVAIQVCAVLIMLNAFSNQLGGAFGGMLGL